MLKQNNSNQDKEGMQDFEEYLKMLEGMEDVQSEDRDMPLLKGIRDEDLNTDDDKNHREYAEFMKRIYDIDIDEMADNSSRRLQSKPYEEEESEFNQDYESDMDKEYLHKLLAAYNDEENDTRIVSPFPFKREDNKPLLRSA